MNETITSVPLLEQAAAAIREVGSFQKELTAQEVAEIMGSVIKNLTAGQDAVRATVLGMQVQIAKRQGAVTGSVQVSRPISATIGLNCTLGNDTAPNRIRLVSLDVQETAGFTAKLALKAINLRGRTESVLRDPNQALFSALGDQLKPKGVKLNEIDLHFGDTTLAVNLRGQRLVK